MPDDGAYARLAERPVRCWQNDHGSALRTTVAPLDGANDFQHLRAWPAVVVRMATVLRETYGADLVMPVTVLDLRLAESLGAALREVDRDLHVCTLVSS